MPDYDNNLKTLIPFNNNNLIPDASDNLIPDDDNRAISPRRKATVPFRFHLICLVLDQATCDCKSWRWHPDIVRRVFIDFLETSWHASRFFDESRRQTRRRLKRSGRFLEWITIS
jgi:hypothetical protein